MNSIIDIETIKTKSKRIINHRFIGLWLAFFYFIIMMIVSLCFHKIGSYGVGTDFYWTYVPEAKSLLAGKLIIDPFRGPFYPFVLALFYKIIPDYFTAGIILNVIAASISIFLISKIIIVLFDETISFFSTLLLILNPIFVQFTYSNGTDMLFFLLSNITIYVFFIGKIKLSKIILLSLFTAFAYLTRYNGVFLIFIIPMMFYLIYPQLNVRIKLKYALIYFALFILFIAPWSLYTYFNKGDFFYNHNYMNIAYEFYAKGKIGWDHFWYTNSSNYKSIFGVLSFEPGKFFLHYVANYFYHFVDDVKYLIGWHVGIFTFGGLVLFIFDRNKKKKQIAYFILNFIFFSILCLVFYSSRFSLFLIPFYSVLAIYFLVSLYRKRVINFSPNYIFTIISILIYISLCWSFSYNMRKINSGPNEILTISNWFNNKYKNKINGATISARKPQIAYYLGMKFKLVPQADSYSSFYHKLKSDHINYLYLSKIELFTRTDLYYLIDTTKTFYGLKRLYFSSKSNCILYKVE